MRKYFPGRKRGLTYLGIFYDDKFQAYTILPQAQGQSGLKSTPDRKDMGWTDMGERAGYNQYGPNLPQIRKQLAAT